MFKSERYLAEEELQKSLSFREASKISLMQDRISSNIGTKQALKKSRTKDKKTTTQPTQPSVHSPVLSLEFSIEGTRSQFRIERIDLKKQGGGRKN
jgi:hypothetical protein